MTRLIRKRMWWEEWKKKEKVKKQRLKDKERLNEKKELDCEKRMKKDKEMERKIKGRTPPPPGKKITQASTNKLLREIMVLKEL